MRSFLVVFFIIFAGSANASDDVKCVQLALNNAQLDVGVADGILGSKTQRAAAKYQEYAGVVAGLPALTNETANRWCEAMRPPLKISDGFWVAKIAGGCGVLTAAAGEYSYSAGECDGRVGLKSVAYEAPNERPNSAVVVGPREIRIEGARCSLGYMVAGNRARCNWTLGDYSEDGVVFERKNTVTGLD